MNHIGQVLSSSSQPVWLNFAKRLIWRIILGRMIQLQTTMTNHIIDPTEVRRVGLAPSVICSKDTDPMILIVLDRLTDLTTLLQIKDIFGMIKDNHYMIQQIKQIVGYHVISCSQIHRSNWPELHSKCWRVSFAKKVDEFKNRYSYGIGRKVD